MGKLTVGKNTKVEQKRRRYVESHWLVFAIKGAISAIAGICMALTFKNDTHYLTEVVGYTLFALAAIEIINVIDRKRLEHNWGLPLAIGLVELLVAITLLFTVDYTVPEVDRLVVRIAIIGGFTLYSATIQLFIGFTCFKNMTDRFMWVVSGIISAILGFVIIADNGADMTTHIKLFGINILVNGLTELYFGIHSRDEMKEIHDERAKRRKQIARAAGKK